MTFLEPLKMDKWVKPLLLYIRGYLNGVDETLQRKINEYHLEKLAGISFVLEAQHSEFGIALVHLLAIPSAVVFGKVDGGRQQVVGIERGIEIGVQFKEGFQVVFGVGRCY